MGARPQAVSARRAARDKGAMQPPVRAFAPSEDLAAARCGWSSTSSPWFPMPHTYVRGTGFQSRHPQVTVIL
ncbi:hypothetical protein GCM10011402_24020 [Paracoccus acridae]|uniref:Uncharacterized protein n=1 Tax=Paracoccus acridae TaxID=1795310 RepID=A0ABQ1VIP6_9RHOB|nr:hypothetical protein GCM10011402_24020 [Paracoccus acridae]